MMQSDIITKLIGQLYDVVLEPLRWTTILEQLSDACDGIGISLAHFEHFPTGAPRMSYTNPAVRVDIEWMAACQKVWINRDLNPLAIPTGEVPLGQVMSFRENMYWKPFQHSVALHEFYHPNRVYPAAVGTLGIDQNIKTRLGFFYDRFSKALDTEALTLLQLLAPHLQRVVQLTHRLAQCHNLRVAAENALDQVPWGIILVNHKGRIYSMNRRAEAILDQADGLTLSQQQLFAAYSEDTRALRKLIHQAMQTTAGQGLEAGGAISLSRPSLKHPLQVLVTPMSRATLWEEPSPPAALIFISDPEQGMELPKQVLQDLYGLTRAESAMAVLMLQGYGLAYAAEQLGVSLNTAKTHQKRICSKTETTRQAELVRVLLTGVAGLAQA